MSSSALADSPETDFPPIAVENWLEILLEFYENEEAAEWLNSPHELLEGETPLDLVRAGRQEEIVQVMDQLRSGAFV